MKDVQAKGEAFQPSRENIQRFKHEILHLFSIFEIIFAPPGP